MLEKLGPAINSGRGMFLFGEAGNDFLDGGDGDGPG